MFTNVTLVDISELSSHLFSSKAGQEQTVVQTYVHGCEYSLQNFLLLVARIQTAISLLLRYNLNDSPS